MNRNILCNDCGEDEIKIGHKSKNSIRYNEEERITYISDRSHNERIKLKQGLLIASSAVCDHCNKHLMKDYECYAMGVTRQGEDHYEWEHEFIKPIVSFTSLLKDI